MSIKLVKRNSAGRRNISYLDNSHLTKKKPEKSLLKSMTKTNGRNSSGRITIRHRGGGAKKKYRIIDYKRTDKLGIPAKVTAIEYDPNRTSNIALLVYKDGEKRYILASEKMSVGNELVCNNKAPIAEGNRMMVKNIPAGFSVYNVEIYKGKGGQIVRSAGSGARVVSHEGKYSQIKLPSGEVRFLHKENFVTVGKVGNSDHSNVRIGKAGRVRNSGRRPQVRGKAMNPCDHPHGGGEGGSPIGLKAPKTPWGSYALGVKTRKKKKPSNKWVAKSRHSN